MSLSSYTSSESFQKRVMPNGLTVMAQQVPATYSVVLGIFVRVGSRDEVSGEAGISHAVEHMVFKATESRTAYEIALALERVGGSLEAHTTKEYTCFFTRVLRDHLDLALDVISDILLNATHTPDDLKLEQGVIVEEINNVFDTPDDWIFEIFSEKLYGSHPMALPILGTADSVKGITQDKLKGFMGRHYVGSNIVISVAGDIQVDATMKKIEESFPFAKGTVDHATAELPATTAGSFFQVDDRLNQEYIVLGSKGMSYQDEDRFPLLLTTTLLGGGMSSRLFQSVREKSGLCYAITAFADFSRDVGVCGSFMAVSPDNLQAAMDLIWLEYDKLQKDGISQRELDDTRDQVKGSILLGLENVASKMTRLAKNEIYYGRQQSTQELLECLDRINLDDIQRMIETCFHRDKSFVVGLGPSESCS